MKLIVDYFIKAIRITIVLMILCGIIYPYLTNGIGNMLFSKQAKGNLVYVDGNPVGSLNVGQEFTKPYFLWGRPSAVGYNTYTESNGVKKYLNGEEFGGLSSGSANYANSNPELKERIEKDIERFLEQHPYLEVKDIPEDIVTASGSGLDPDITVPAAMIQVGRIAKYSGLTEQQVIDIINKNTKNKLFNIFGTKHVNVLLVNIDIAKAMKSI